ncbi:hypothetical protein Tco_1055323 [Tanacetum coccineum]|uniref:Reverse transcriptase domain-containing protein n=1 Tax=Tanacetum coccineum TaxID=301880 RepID=A0ABQ5H0I5_9ASTR
MTNGIEETPPPGFSTLTPLPGPNVGELPPLTVSTFTARSPENTPLTNRASTSTNLDHVICSAFIEANYEVLESLLREHRKQIRNKDLRTELDYYSEEYDEEREMEPRHAQFEEAPNRVERESDGRRPTERRIEEGGSRGGNLPPLLATHLGRSENGQPLQSTLTSGPKGVTLPLEGHPLSSPRRAKFRSHFSQQKKFMTTHLAVHNIKQKDGESTKAFVTRYTDDTLLILGLHEEQRNSGFVHGLKTRSLMEFLSTDLPTTYKGIKKGKVKVLDTQLSKWKKGDKDIVPAEAPILMAPTIPQIMLSLGSEYPKDTSIGSLRVDSKTPLVGFSGEYSWPLGEVPLEVTIEEGPYTRTEVLNFMTVRSNSPYNLLLGRTTMQKMESNKIEEGQKKIKETIPEVTKDVLSCVGVEERVIVNDRYPKQTVVIGKQLPTCYKKKLQDLLRSNADIFAWTYADMTGIPRTIMVEGKPFSTEHALNEYKHVEPVKQKKRWLAPDLNEAACKSGRAH